MIPSVLCFRKTPATKKFMDKGGGEFQDFLSKNVCLTVPKFTVDGGGESFTVAIISGRGKVSIRGGGESTFSAENFLSHSAENFCKGNL